MGQQQTTHEAIAATLRKAAAALRKAEVPFMLGGSLACWARGGPRSQNDLDLMLPREHAERAMRALEQEGMRIERPPEDWLVKAWDGDVMVDLIFESLGLGPITQELVERAERMQVLAMTMRVMSVEDVLVGKLLSVSEQYLEYSAPLEAARSLRERVDWGQVRRRTSGSPYAKAFMGLLEQLEVVDPLAEAAMPAEAPAPAAALAAASGSELAFASAPARAGAGHPRAMVLGPMPLLTVTIEPGAGPDHPEVHLHAGGQGVWAARMARILGARVQLCAALGGESGLVIRGLVGAQGIGLRGVAMAGGANGTYVHDRRSGHRLELADQPGPALSRHELDSLYTEAVASGLQSDVALLTGTPGEAAVGEDFYRRLTLDLAGNGKQVVVDLPGRQLRGALAGGVTVAKVRDRELVHSGYATDTSPRALMDGLGRLCEAGARSAIVSRGPQPALAYVEGERIELAGPRLHPNDPRGTGDSQSAAIAVALGRGQSAREALRLGMAAGALNVTRRGLGSGEPAAIGELAARIEIRPWGAGAVVEVG